MCNPSFAKNNIHDGSIDQQDIYAKTYKVYIYIYIYIYPYIFSDLLVGLLEIMNPLS